MIKSFLTLSLLALLASLAACGGGGCDAGRPGVGAQAQAEYDAECATPPAPPASAAGAR